MVAGAERPELRLDLGAHLLGPSRVKGSRLQPLRVAVLFHEDVRGVQALSVVAPAYSRRDQLTDDLQNGPLVPDQLLALEGGLSRDHAAPNVNADGVWHDPFARPERGPHGWAVPEVSVGHERQVALHDVRA